MVEAATDGKESEVGFKAVLEAGEGRVVVQQVAEGAEVAGDFVAEVVGVFSCLATGRICARGRGGGRRGADGGRGLWGHDGERKGNVSKKFIYLI